MSPKKKKTKPATPPHETHGDLRRAADQRRGVAATVIWMTTAVFALFGEILALAAMGVIATGLVSGGLKEVRLVGQIGLLIACFTGLLCLALTPIAIRFSDPRPPPAVTWFNLAVAIAPWTTALVQWLGSW